MRLLISLAVLLAGVGQIQAVAAPGDLLQTFPIDVGPGQLSETSVAVLGNNVIVGVGCKDVASEDDGAAYLFDAETGDLIRVFTNPSPVAGDHFGRCVTSMGDNVLIGSPSSVYAPAPTPGVAYMFDTAGNLLQTFDNPAPNPHDGFGNYVAATIDTVAISAPNDDTRATDHGDTGAVYLFDAAGSLQHTLFGHVRSGGDYFGCSVATVGDNFLIGAGGSGETAYLFNSSGDLLQTFENPTGQGGRFGQRVAALANDVLIAAPYDGAAYLFDGETGDLLQTLYSPLPNSDHFGSSIGAVGNDILVGQAHVGAVHVFDRSGDPIHTLLRPASDQDGGFGHAIAATGNDIVIGGGATAYLFRGMYLTSGTSGSWHDAGTWDDESLVPVEELGAVVQNHAVTVGKDSVASWLSIGDSSGEVIVGPVNTLAVINGIDVAEGELCIEGTLNAGAVHVSAGTLRIAPTGRLNVRQESTFAEGSELEYELGPSNAPIVAAGGIVLEPGSTLSVQATSKLGAVGLATRTLINAAGDSTIIGTFSTKPAAAEYLGFGVWCEGVAYKANAVDLRVFQAADGDADGDRDIDADDIQAILAANTFPSRNPAGWSTGDFTGDGWCDGNDVQLILATNLFGQGPYASMLSDAEGALQARAVVPEPSTLAVLVVALIVLLAGAWARRRR